ncbi:MAG: hypothetical protein ACFFCM_00705 [Promethearchaeota archaeon]
MNIIIKIECKKCGNEFHANLEQLEHYFYCPICECLGNINQIFEIISVEA